MDLLSDCVSKMDALRIGDGIDHDSKGPKTSKGVYNPLSILWDELIRQLSEKLSRSSEVGQKIAKNEVKVHSTELRENRKRKREDRDDKDDAQERPSKRRRVKNVVVPTPNQKKRKTFRLVRTMPILLPSFYEFPTRCSPGRTRLRMCYLCDTSYFYNEAYCRCPRACRCRFYCRKCVQGKR